MASCALVFPVLEAPGQHDQELVARYEEAHQGAGGILDREIRKLPEYLACPIVN